MPSTSPKQRRYLAHRFGEKWLREHHFDKLKTAKRKAPYARRR
jgi:hypothetical protein